MAPSPPMKTTMQSRVRAYLAQRRALGFRLRSEGYLLLSFARYADRHARGGRLTHQLAMAWASLPKNADRHRRARRWEAVRRLAKFLIVTDPKTQMPPRHLFGPAKQQTTISALHLQCPAHPPTPQGGGPTTGPTSPLDIPNVNWFVGLHRATHLRSAGAQNRGGGSPERIAPHPRQQVPANALGSLAPDRARTAPSVQSAPSAALPIS